jgi:hypothetical protein
MKAEKEVKSKLKWYKKLLKETEQRFEEYDNHDDMDLIPVYEEVVEILKWVLEI